MLKKVILISVFFILNSNIFAQTLDSSWKQLYIHCLKNHMEYLRDLKLKDTLIYIEENEIILQLDELPLNLKAVSPERLHKLTACKKNIHLVQISPIILNQHGLKLQVIDFTVGRKRKHYSFENFGGSSYEIIYDCKTGLFEIQNVHNSQP